MIRYRESNSNGRPNCTGNPGRFWPPHIAVPRENLELLTEVTGILRARLSFQAGLVLLFLTIATQASAWHFEYQGTSGGVFTYQSYLNQGGECREQILQQYGTSSVGELVFPYAEVLYVHQRLPHQFAVDGFMRIKQPPYNGPCGACSSAIRQDVSVSQEAVTGVRIVVRRDVNDSPTVQLFGYTRYDVSVDGYGGRWSAGSIDYISGSWEPGPQPVIYSPNERLIGTAADGTVLRYYSRYVEAYGEYAGNTCEPTWRGRSIPPFAYYSLVVRLGPDPCPNVAGCPSTACLDTWNKDLWSISSNCYNYASNRPAIPYGARYAQPGRGGGLPGTSWFEMDVEGIRARLLADNVQYIGDDDAATCPSGCRIALVMDPYWLKPDFHFLRENADGSWSHKPGHYPATDRDSAKNIIQNPRLAQLWHGKNHRRYSVFGGYYCVTGGSNISKLAGDYSYSADPDTLFPVARATTVEEMEYSGRPNGIVVLEPTDEPAIVAKIAALHTTVDDPLWGQSGDWYGMLVRLRGQIGEFIIRDAIVAVINNVPGATTYYADDVGLTEWIVARLPAEASAVEPAQELGEDVNVGPNPFNPSTSITYRVANAGAIRVSVFDTRGRLVKVLQDEVCTAGQHSVRWCGDDSDSRPVSAGVYIVSVEGEGGIRTAKVAMLK